jgi:hypothetical protein
MISKTINILGSIAAVLLLVGMFTGDFHFNTKDDTFDFFFVAFMIVCSLVDFVKTLLDKSKQ